MSTAETTAAAPTETTLPARVAVQGGDLYSDSALFEHVQRVAKVFASSELVPAHMRGKVADCILAIDIARRMGAHPLEVMQAIYIVHGRPGWSAPYLIAQANRSGRFAGPIDWRVTGKGDSLSVTAFATLASSGREVSATVDMATAKAEEWTRNAKYRTMPELMLRYRSATWLVRWYVPEATYGMATSDELVDVARRPDAIDVPVEPETAAAPPVDAQPPKSGVDALRSALHAGDAPPPPAQAAEPAPTAQPASPPDAAPISAARLKVECADIEAELAPELVQQVRRECAVPDVADIGTWRGRPEAVARYLAALRRLSAEAQRQPDPDVREPGEEG